MFLLKALKKHEEETEQLAVDWSKNTQSSKSHAPQGLKNDKKMEILKSPSVRFSN